MVMFSRRWVARLGASLLVAGAGAVGLAAPQATVPAASAATCSGSSGVTVVVDFRELGGGLVTACAPDGGGKSAAAISAAAGVTLSYATRQPGFVCRVNGAPSADPCVNASPADAYWGLWWGDGSRSTWSYSSQGAGGVTVPDGGAVGWSWQQDRTAGDTVAPGIPVPVTKGASSPSPSPTPAPAPTTKPSSSPKPSPTSPPARGSGTPTAAPTAGSEGRTAPSPSATASEGAGGADAQEPQAGDSPSATPSLGAESPSDSRSSDPTDPASPATALDPESPSDSRSSGTSGEGEGSADAASPDGPTRVPAVVTWGVVGLLGAAVVASAVMTRRRRTGRA